MPSFSRSMNSASGSGLIDNNIDMNLNEDDLNKPEKNDDESEEMSKDGSRGIQKGFTRLKYTKCKRPNLAFIHYYELFGDEEYVQTQQYTNYSNKKDEIGNFDKGLSYNDYIETSKAYTPDQVQKLVNLLVDDPEWWTYFSNPPTAYYENKDYKKPSTNNKQSNNRYVNGPCEFDTRIFANSKYNRTSTGKQEQTHTTPVSSTIKKTDSCSSSLSSYSSSSSLSSICSTCSSFSSFDETLNTLSTTSTSSSSSSTKSNLSAKSILADIKKENSQNTVILLKSNNKVIQIVNKSNDNYNNNNLIINSNEKMIVFLIKNEDESSFSNYLDKYKKKRVKDKLSFSLKRTIKKRNRNLNRKKSLNNYIKYRLIESALIKLDKYSNLNDYNIYFNKINKKLNDNLKQSIYFEFRRFKIFIHLIQSYIKWYQINNLNTLIRDKNDTLQRSFNFLNKLYKMGIDKLIWNSKSSSSLIQEIILKSKQDENLKKSQNELLTKISKYICNNELALFSFNNYNNITTKTTIKKNTGTNNKNGQLDNLISYFKHVSLNLHQQTPSHSLKLTNTLISKD